MQAIGFPIAAKVVESAASAGVIEAQLSRYQTQLADWCNCPSGKTPAGKEKIQELQDKVDAAKAQLEKMATVKAQRQSTSGRGNSSPDSSDAGYTASPGSDSPDELPISTARRVIGTPIGGSVDVFA